MKSLKRGLLITLEGIDGSGKSTLAQALSNALQEKNIPVILTREPGGSELGNRLRTMLQDRTVSLCPKAEYLLFAADRAQHMHDVVIPNIEKGFVVISDRMDDSSVVYQGYGRGLDIDMIKSVNNWAMDGITPDLTLYLKISPEDAHTRLKKRSDKLTALEKDIHAFREKLVHGFDTLFASRNNVVTLDALKKVELLVEASLDSILDLLDVA